MRFNEDLTFYIRHGNNRYRVRYRPVAGPARRAADPGPVKVDRCTDSNGTGCNSATALCEPTVTALAVLSSTGIPPGGTAAFRAAFPNVFTFAAARFNVVSQGVIVTPTSEEMAPAANRR